MHGKTSPVVHDQRGLFAGIPSPMEAMRYHSLVVDSGSVPTELDAEGNGWALTAWTDEDLPGGGTRRVVMGLRRVWADKGSSFGRQPVEGVQFHPESFMTPEGPRLLANFLAMGERGRVVDEARIESITA